MRLSITSLVGGAVAFVASCNNAATATNNTAAKSAEAKPEVEKSEAVKKLCNDMEFAAGLGLAMVYHENKHHDLAQLAASTSLFLSAAKLYKCDLEKLAENYQKMAGVEQSNWEEEFKRYLDSRSDVPPEEKTRLLDALP